jgi:monoamine oxidase
VKNEEMAGSRSRQLNKFHPPRSLQVGSKPDRPFRAVVIGGGPCGLFTAWNLARKTGTACHIKVLEATDRLGGKIWTKEFPGVGIYEAGVAEIYDYSITGPDPLRDLIEKDLGLKIKHIAGGACVLDTKLLQNAEDLALHFGARTRDAVIAFRSHCARLLSPAAFYKSAPFAENQHPWAKMTGEKILATEIKDERARRYIRIMAHSDVAGPPHKTNGLTFLKNVLMDVDGYMDIFSVMGGNEEIVNRLTDQLDAEVHLNAPVRTVEPLPNGTYRIEAGPRGAEENHIADFVAVAVPLTALSLIDWRSEELQFAIGRHTAHFDRPAHYVRATLLFERPFWREFFSGAWWMIDAFDGCAVYDEGARHPLGSYGALGFLIAGNAALWLANLSNDQIEQLCLDALPPAMAHGRRMLVDRRIHRWMASVSAQPGGFPARTLRENHWPEPDRLPGVFMVGDYIFDATLNGAFDSSDNVTDMILSEILMRRRSISAIVYEEPVEQDRSRQANGTAFTPIGFATAEQDQVYNGLFITDMIKLIWGLERAKILVVGPVSGLAAAATHYDGDLTSLPFPDGHFDVIIETALCYLTRERVKDAANEFRRVARWGLVLGSVTCDLSIDLLERYDLRAGVKNLASRWDWSEQLQPSGFEVALLNPGRLAQIWERAKVLGAGPGAWYDEPESILYSFYDRGKSEVRTAPLFEKWLVPDRPAHEQRVLDPTLNSDSIEGLTAIVRP